MLQYINPLTAQHLTSDSGHPLETLHITRSSLLRDLWSLAWLLAIIRVTTIEILSGILSSNKWSLDYPKICY